MGVLRQGILGGFRGKVGNVIGTGWKGRAVIKAMPLSVANPRTAGQVKQRTRFSHLVSFASLVLAAWIKPLWDRAASGMSGYNAFVSANRDVFGNGLDILDDQIIMSRGRMIAPKITAKTITGRNLTLTVSNPLTDRFALPTDKLFIAVTGAGFTEVGFAGQTSQTRTSNATVQVTVALDAQLDITGDVRAWAAYLRADGSEVSNSSEMFAV